jgi:outer membrane protein assembly factor BamB
MKNIWFSIICIFVFTSCLGCWSGIPENPPSVSCDVAFREPTSFNSSCSRPLLLGDTLYLLVGSARPDYLLAYDLKNQKVLWRYYPTEDFAVGPDDVGLTENFCVIGAHLWVPEYSGGVYYLAEIGLLDGKRYRLVRLIPYSENFGMSGCSTASYGSKVFFFNTEGLLYCDIDNLNLLDAQRNLYEGTILEACPFDDTRTVGYHIESVGDQFVYSYCHIDDIFDTGLVRFDPVTMQKKWDIAGESFFNYFAYHDGAIYSGVDTRERPDKHTARFVRYDWESGELLASYASGDYTMTPPLFVDGRVIQTATSNDYYFGAGKPMIFCLDDKTLALKWKHDVDVKNIYTGSNCQESNGIVYQPRVTGMWLYDLQTGEILGIDESIQASDTSSIVVSFKYGDLLVIPNGEELLGIRMNFRNGPHGLVKG